MKTHSRCRSCGARKKLNRQPLEYEIQPICQCGARNWRKDEYRHRVELPQMRARQGRYRVCHCDGLIQFKNAHPHRIGCRQCCYQADGEAKEMRQMEADLAYLQGAENENNGYLEDKNMNPDQDSGRVGPFLANVQPGNVLELDIGFPTATLRRCPNTGIWVADEDSMITARKESKNGN